MGYYFKGWEVASKAFAFTFLLVCIFMLSSNTIYAQKNSGVLPNQTIDNNTQTIGELDIDINKEPQILAFVSDLEDNLQGKNQDQFQSNYKFNEKSIEDWVLQFVSKDKNISTEELQVGLDKIQKITSDAYNTINSLCGYNYKVEEVLSYKPKYADPQKRSYLVELNFQLVGSEDSILLHLKLGYINGAFLLLNAVKRAL